MYSIDTLKTLKTKEIVKVIKNGEVEEYVIETIAYSKKLPSRKFYNPEVYKAILYTSPYEEIAVNILEKLIEKNKADLYSFMLFFENKNISKKFFNAYLQMAIDIIDERILKIINQADPRIDEKFLKEIIEKNYEKPEILLNKNLDKDDFLRVAKRHIKETEYQVILSKFNLNKFNRNLIIEIAANVDKEKECKEWFFLIC